MIRHRKKNNIHHNTQISVNFIERFFESFSNFQYNSSKSSTEEYQRLRKSYGWRRDHSEKKKNMIKIPTGVDKKIQSIV